MTRTSLRAAFIVAAFLLNWAVAPAQVTTGLPPFGSFSGGPFDTVNNANLNVHFEVPVIRKAGRGVPFFYILSNDSSVWYPVASVWTPVSMMGWRGVTEIATGYVTYKKTQNTCSAPSGQYTYNTYSNWIYHDAFGV